METYLPGFILGLREGLEAFLVISIIYRYLQELKRPDLNSFILKGAVAGILGSLVLGAALFSISDFLGGASKFTKVWEGVTSLLAVMLVGTFIKWMIDHGKTFVSDVKNQVGDKLTPIGVFLIALVMIGREGTEIAVFSFAGKYNLGSVFIGILISLLLTYLIYHSIVKVKISALFQVTLVYLVFQAAFLFGYGVHELLASFKAYGLLAADSPLLAKAFNLSGTIFNHKSGILGLPMMVTFGWYSKPEIIQLAAHLSFLGLTFGYWKKVNDKEQVPSMA